MDIDDAVDWYLIARKAQAEIERLRAALKNVRDTCRLGDRTDTQIVVACEEIACREIGAVNEQTMPDKTTG